MSDGKRLTMEDVAREVGVSRALVSIAFRDAPGISDDTKHTILETARRLGYRRDAIAARLASRRTNTLGFFLLDLYNEVFADIFAGARDGADKAARQLVLAVGDVENPREDRSVEGLIDARVDAILMAGSLLPDEQLLRYSRSRPIVLITRRIPGMDSITTDDFRGGWMATHHLIELGHRSIAHIASPDGPNYRERRSGYESAMRGAGLTPQVAEAAFTQLAAARAAARLLDAATPPTAIFANNDIAALGVLDVLHQRGMSAPHDLSLVGYDNTRIAALPALSLTSIDQHSRELGARAARAALDRVQNPDAPPVEAVLAPTLVARRSTAEPPRGSARSR